MCHYLLEPVVLYHCTVMMVYSFQKESRRALMYDTHGRVFHISDLGEQLNRLVSTEGDIKI